METNPTSNQTTAGLKFDLKLILKLSGILAVVFLLFMPVAGCQGTDIGNIKGIDIITKAKDMDITIKIFFILSVLSAAIAFFFKKYMHIAMVAFGGIASLLIAFFIAQAKTGYKGIELKTGSYLAILVYLSIAIICIIKKVSESKNSPVQSFNTQNPNFQPQQTYQSNNPQTITPSPPSNQNSINYAPPIGFRPKFCPKCGNKFTENFTGKFCTACGNKITS